MSWACAIQPEVRYFRTSNENVPGSLFFLPLVKGNEDSGYDFENRTEQRVLFVIQGF